jgi:hypothetical protein
MTRKTGVSAKYLDKDSSRKSAKKIELLASKESILNCDDKLFPRSNNKLDFVFRIEESGFVPHILSHIYGKKI